MKHSKHNRIYVAKQIQIGHELILEDKIAHYVKNVLRKDTQSHIRVFNQTNGEFLAKIISTSKNLVAIAIEEQIRSYQKEKSLILGLCIIKPDRMLSAIQGAVQIGVTEIYPLISERTQYNIINTPRYNRCIIESVEQSERLSIPKLYEPDTIKSFIDNAHIKQIIYANENENDTCSLSKELLQRQSNIAYLVGPEGGFSANEEAFITSCKHVTSISLGPNILRTEIATIVGLGILQFNTC